MMVELEYITDELRTDRYVFWFDEGRKTLWLHRYEVIVKETSRHKPKVVKMYDRLKSQDNTMDIRDIPLNDKIKKDVINKLVSMIKVDFWFK